MARFKKLTLGRMPRVFVAILADERAREIVNAIRSALPLGLVRKLDADHGLAAATFLRGILELPKDERLKIVPLIDEALEDLASQDFFGTEGQLDPRGDPRG